MKFKTKQGEKLGKQLPQHSIMQYIVQIIILYNIFIQIMGIVKCFQRVKYQKNVIDPVKSKRKRLLEHKAFKHKNLLNKWHGESQTSVDFEVDCWIQNRIYVAKIHMG